MKFTDHTIKVLKSLANINDSILFPEGNCFRSVNETGDIFGMIVTDQTFEKEFAIYHLGELLSTVGLLNDPQLEIKDGYMDLKGDSGRSKIKYFFTDPDMIKKAPKNVKMASPEIAFELDWSTLNKVKKAADTFGYHEFYITNGDGCIELAVADIDPQKGLNRAGNTFSISVPGTFPKNAEFKFFIDLSKMGILMVGDYKIEVTKSKAAHFTLKNSPPGLSTEYYIATEKHSTYGEK